MPTTTHTSSAEKSPIDEKASYDLREVSASPADDSLTPRLDGAPPKRRLPYAWQLVMIIMTCMCTFGNHWSNALIVALKTTIIKETNINNSQFATLVAITNLVNTFLCIGFGFAIDKWGGAIMSVILAGFHLSGSVVMAGAATNNLNSYPLLIVGKVLAAIGDGSLDNAQHRIFSTYFAPGRGFAFSIGTIWGIANLAQFTGQSTANVITRNLGSYAWALWISSIIALFSFGCAITVVFLDRYLRNKYDVTDHTSGKRHKGATIKGGTFTWKGVRHLSVSFWLVVLFAIFENAGVQSFVSISTQFSQQRLKKGAVIGGWVSSFYLLLPACLTPFLGIYIDVFGQRIGFLFVSGLTFLISMLLLKFSQTIPTFIAAYVFYALSQCVTPAPQVEIIRSIIPDPRYFATGFAIKKSVVQASIVIITTAAGKLQDDTANNSLEPAISLWLAYALVSVVVSGAMLAISYFWPTLLPASRLSQVSPRELPNEVERLARLKGIQDVKVDDSEESNETREMEKMLKAPKASSRTLNYVYLSLGMAVIVIGWILFGLGVSWGVHGSVVAGTTGE